MLAEPDQIIVGDSVTTPSHPRTIRPVGNEPSADRLKWFSGRRIDNLSPRLGINSQTPGDFGVNPYESPELPKRSTAAPRDSMSWFRAFKVAVMWLLLLILFGLIVSLIVPVQHGPR